MKGFGVEILISEGNESDELLAGLQQGEKEKEALIEEVLDFDSEFASEISINIRETFKRNKLKREDLLNKDTKKKNRKINQLKTLNKRQHQDDETIEILKDEMKKQIKRDLVSVQSEANKESASVIFDRTNSQNLEINNDVSVQEVQPRKSLEVGGRNILLELLSDADLKSGNKGSELNMEKDRHFGT